MKNNNKQPTFEFYFRCKCCNCVLNHNSYNVKNGIQESPYCSKCSSVSFDSSGSEREYEHQYLSDLNLVGFTSYSDDYE